MPLVPLSVVEVPKLKALGAPILMTACYNPGQMLLASGLGADYIAPYFGRMLEKQLPGYEAIEQMLAVERTPGNKTRLLVASLRNLEQLTKLAEMGCTYFTLSAALLDELLTDENSEAAVMEFEKVAAG